MESLFAEIEHTEQKQKTEKKPHFLGHRKRLKEKFVKAVATNNSDVIADYEILEILLFASYPRKDVKPLAKELIDIFGSFANLISAPIEEIKNKTMLGESAIAAIKIVQVSANRLLKANVHKKIILQSWKSLLDYCHASMGYEKKEQFRILFLDKKNQLIADEIQQQGTVDHTPVYPREVAKRALENSASAIILVHNHPSGDATPSKADINVTEQIMQGLAALDIKLHDHLIIAGDKHYSFAAHGLI
jgi:DNA repair protein RadC